MRTRTNLATRHRTRIVAAMGAAALLSGCNMVVMNPTGDIALQQRNLILLSIGLMLLIIVPVMVLTVLFAWRYRRGNASKVYDPGFDHSTTLELAIWSFPLLIIIALSSVTWTSTHLLDPFRPLERLGPGRPIPKGVTPMDVQVVALDWKWLFIYPQQGIATVNELALPVDVPVRFSITSTDQFNTFYAPTLAGMIYAMPGMQSQLNAVLNKPGDSWGYSGNYTGRGYSDMRFRLRGMTQSDFASWAANAKQGGGSLDTATYLRLAQPSEKVAVIRYASVDPQLYPHILNRCVERGKPCLVDVTARDMARTGHELMPPGREAPPPSGGKPVPALETSPLGKGSGPNVTTPATAPPPGQARPGDPRNRNLSSLIAPSLPGDVRAAIA
ncbi:ubiquinol oxidase subunit II [Sphingomonas oryzagri]